MARWDHKLQLVDVWKNERLTFEQRRDEIVHRIKVSTFYDTDNYDLTDIVDRLQFAEDADEFDYVWTDFYDYADAERVWVATF